MLCTRSPLYGILLPFLFLRVKSILPPPGYPSRHPHLLSHTHILLALPPRQKNPITSHPPLLLITLVLSSERGK